MAILKFAGFITFTLLVIFGLHYLLYSTFVRFWGITDPGTRKLIMGLVVFLALSFFPSALLLRVHVNFITSLYYIIAATWLGIFIYLLMAMAVTWLVFGLGKAAGAAPNMQIVWTCFFIIAVGVSVFGIWKARNPEIKEVSVKIDRLPAQWENRTIVQLSDVHLGILNGTGFMETVTEKVNSLNPYLVLITGDLFDGMGGNLDSFIEPLNSLRAEEGVYFITGNHEGYLGLQRPLDVISKTKINILDNRIEEIDGIQIVGVSFPEFDRQNGVRKLLGESGPYDRNKPAILMYHTPTNIIENHTDRGAQQTNTYWLPDIRTDFVQEIGIDLQLSGHTHSGQFFPFDLISKKIFREHNYGLSGNGKFNIYTSSGTGTWGPPMRIGTPSEIVAINLQRSSPEQ